MVFSHIRRELAKLQLSLALVRRCKGFESLLPVIFDPL